MGEEVIILPVLFIGLPWIVLHYVTKWKTAATITNEDEGLLEELYNLAKRLDERMDTVERLVASDNADFKPARIQHDRHAATEFRVDDSLNPLGGCEIRLPQGKPDRVQRGKVKLNLALYPRARRDRSSGGHTLHHTGRLPIRRDAPRNDRPLRHRVNLTVRTIQRRHHQRPAQQAFCVTNS